MQRGNVDTFPAVTATSGRLWKNCIWIRSLRPRPARAQVFPSACLDLVTRCDKMRQDATSIDTATGITGCRLNFESSLLVVRRLHKFLEIMSEGSCYEFHRQQSQTPKPSFVKMFQRIREVAA